MKKIFYVLSVVLILGLSASAQDSLTPTPVIIGEIGANNYQVLYPLGWSEGGNFSYIWQDINYLSGTAMYAYTVIVQDMITDSILWKKEMMYDLEGEKSGITRISEDQIPKDDTFYNYSFFKEIVWKAYVDQIIERLDNFNIKRTNISLLPLAELEKQGISVIPTQRELIEQYVVDYKIEVVFSGKNRKTIYWHTDPPLSEDKRSSIWYKRYKILGYFSSPFENRVAIVVLLSEPGFEEPFEYPFLVGAYLDYRF